jgi:opacity protein-like surface antigen
LLLSALALPLAAGALVVDVGGPPGDRWGIRALAGLSLPSGDLAGYTKGQASAGLQVSYALERRFSLLGSYGYAAMPYKNPGSSQPFSSHSLGLRGRYDAYQDSPLTLYVDAGLGLFLVSHAVVDPYAADPASRFTAASQSETGFGILAGGGAEYQVMTHLDLVADLALNSVNLNGGLGNNVLFTALSVGLKVGF